MEDFISFIQRHPTWKIEFNIDNEWILIKITGTHFHIEESTQPCHFVSILTEIEDKFQYN